jgi:hypothetical protein
MRRPFFLLAKYEGQITSILVLSINIQIPKFTKFITMDTRKKRLKNIDKGDPLS